MVSLLTRSLKALVIALVFSLGAPALAQQAETVRLVVEKLPTFSRSPAGPTTILCLMPP